MGGYGSGRWGWHRTKGTTDPLLRIDVRHLARQGLIAPSVVGSLPVAWSRGERPAGDILVRYDDARPDEVILKYRVRRQDGEAWAQIRERVALDRTPCPFGGWRPWFRCPGCGERRAVLYGAGSRFRCRVCHGLAYASTREGAPERNRRRAEELRRRMGCEPGPFSAPRKPKGMHRTTYERIVSEIARREGTAHAAFGAEAATLLARLDRRHGPPAGE